MLQGLIGTKLDQSQAFLENGKRVPLSLIAVSGNVVTQIKNMEKDSYSAVQIGFGLKKRANKAAVGHSKKAGIEKTPRFFHEIRMEDTAAVELGKALFAEEMFELGDVINVTGTSKGKGYAGVVKRHHFKGGPRTHGQSDRERAPGSIGQTTTPGRVYKGKRMSGRMGSDTVTIKNLVVIDIKDGVLYVKGLVPGVKGGTVFISKSQDNKMTKAIKKKFIPLYKEVEEVVDEPKVEEVVVETLPENPEEVAEAQAEIVEKTQDENPVEAKPIDVEATVNKEEAKNEEKDETPAEPEVAEAKAEEEVQTEKEEVK